MQNKIQPSEIAKMTTKYYTLYAYNKDNMEISILNNTYYNHNRLEIYLSGSHEIEISCYSFRMEDRGLISDDLAIQLIEYMSLQNCDDISVDDISVDYINQLFYKHGYKECVELLTVDECIIYESKNNIKLG